MPDVVQVAHLLAEVWQTPASCPPVPTDVLRALAHEGGYVAGAYLDRQLVGASVGFLDARGGLHSHISGVLAAARGRNVGAALKLHQRTWALDRGLPRFTWTVDPLQRRHAWCNLTKLGGTAAEYLPDFYGDMSDRLNAGDESDRLYVLWDLASSRAEAAADGSPLVPEEQRLRDSGSASGPDEDEDGSPVRSAPSSAGTLSCCWCGPRHPAPRGPARVPAAVSHCRADPLPGHLSKVVDRGWA